MCHYWMRGSIAGWFTGSDVRSKSDCSLVSNRLVVMNLMHTRPHVSRCLSPFILVQVSCVSLCLLAVDGTEFLVLSVIMANVT
jgi:hypothetical protein